MWFWDQTLVQQRAWQERVALTKIYMRLICTHPISIGVCHGDFGAACSTWEIRAEIRLGQKLYRLRWGGYSNPFHAGAASFRSTRGIQGHQHNRIYSVVCQCINEISVQMSKFVPCRFRAPSSRAKARTHARCCPRALRISWEGFSTLSSAHRSNLP